MCHSSGVPLTVVNGGFQRPAAPLFFARPFLTPFASGLARVVRHCHIQTPALSHLCLSFFCPSTCKSLLLVPWYQQFRFRIKLSLNLAMWGSEGLSLEASISAFERPWSHEKPTPHCSVVWELIATFKIKIGPLHPPFHHSPEPST